MIEVYSGLIKADSNEAEFVNAIDANLLKECANDPLPFMKDIAMEADAYVAHNAVFDKSFMAPHGFDDKPWICTLEDFTWPIESPSKGLVPIALAHGVGVVAAHRAINDCLLIARLFERVEDSSERLMVALQRAKRPKYRYVSLAPFEMKDLVKSFNFRWDPDSKEWWRNMSQEDTVELPFKVKRGAQL